MIYRERAKVLKMSKIIYTFNDFKAESVYKVDADGKFTKKVISYYKDHYPEKYGLEVSDTKFTWVIKRHEEKICLVSGTVPEQQIQEMVSMFENIKDGTGDGNTPLEKLD
jgi:hypothetical protein